LAPAGHASARSCGHWAPSAVVDAVVFVVLAAAASTGTDIGTLHLHAAVSCRRNAIALEPRRNACRTRRQYLAICTDTHMRSFSIVRDTPTLTFPVLFFAPDIRSSAQHTVARQTFVVRTQSTNLALRHGSQLFSYRNIRQSATSHACCCYIAVPSPLYF
jgi:hypothetical protein